MAALADRHRLAVVATQQRSRATARFAGRWLRSPQACGPARSLGRDGNRWLPLGGPRPACQVLRGATGPTVPPLPRDGWRPPPTSARLAALRPGSRSRRRAARLEAAEGWPSEMAYLLTWSPGRRHQALRTGARANADAWLQTRPRARPLIEKLGYPGLLPRRPGRSPTSAGATASTARGGAGARPTAQCGTPHRHHQRRRHCPRPHCSSGSLSEPRTDELATSTSTSSRAGGRRSSSTSTTPTGASTPPRSPTSSPPPRQVGDPRHGQGLRLRPGQQDAWSKQVDAWGSVASTATRSTRHPSPGARPGPADRGLPRHLGIHSGGMVISNRPYRPRNAWSSGPPMADRSRARVGQGRLRRGSSPVKFDLLGLEMLSALRRLRPGAGRSTATRSSCATLPPEDPAVYEMLCRSATPSACSRSD